MPNVFKTIINISVWILFLKGLLAVALTLYTVIKALADDGNIPMTAVAGCAAGAFAFILACVAAWIRQKVS
jgi:predicted acylesterase/phospholipase RssA